MASAVALAEGGGAFSAMAGKQRRILGNQSRVMMELWDWKRNAWSILIA